MQRRWQEIVDDIARSRITRDPWPSDAEYGPGIWWPKRFERVVGQLATEAERAGLREPMLSKLRAFLDEQVVAFRREVEKR